MCRVLEKKEVSILLPQFLSTLGLMHGDSNADKWCCPALHYIYWMVYIIAVACRCALANFFCFIGL